MLVDAVWIQQKNGLCPEYKFTRWTKSGSSEIFSSACQNYSSHIVCNVLLCSLWVPLTYGGLQVYFSFCDARLIVKKRGKPCSSRDCNHPRWDTREHMLHPKDVRKSQKAHMLCDHCWYFASSPCSACSSLCDYHWGLPVTVIISRRHMHTSRGSSYAALGSSSSAHLALGAHIPQEGHLPRWSPDISHKLFREPGHGALKKKTDWLSP